MICPRCGKNVTDGYNFCPNCGAQLTTTNSNISPIHSKEAFYKKTWVLVLACVLLPPLGIAFLWMAKRPTGPHWCQAPLNFYKQINSG